MGKTTASSDTTQGLRRIVARRDGYRCYLCGVPTAATLEHIAPRQGGGRSKLENLRLACPYCNSVKGASPVEEFLAQERWRIEPPEELPESTRDMLVQCYGWRRRDGIVYSGSSNAHLEVRGNFVSVMVRAGIRDGWHSMTLGPQSNPRVTLAAWDFLRRHNTPPRPRRRPSAKVLAASRKARPKIPEIRPS